MIPSSRPHLLRSGIGKVDRCAAPVTLQEVRQGAIHESVGFHFIGSLTAISPTISQVVRRGCVLTRIKSRRYSPKKTLDFLYVLQYRSKKSVKKSLHLVHRGGKKPYVRLKGLLAFQSITSEKSKRHEPSGTHVEKYATLYAVTCQDCKPLSCKNVPLPVARAQNKRTAS